MSPRSSRSSRSGSSRRLVLVLGAIAVAFAIAFVLYPRSKPLGDSVVVYYTKLDGNALGSFRISLGNARDLQSVAFYAATQALAGPPSGTQAIRFPNGTHVLALNVSGSTAKVDISKEINASAGGGFTEAGEFKALVWTLTALPGIQTVDVRVGGARLTTLPGGHFELDEPLARSSW